MHCLKYIIIVLDHQSCPPRTVNFFRRRYICCYLYQNLRYLQHELKHIKKQEARSLCLYATSSELFPFMETLSFTLTKYLYAHL